MPLPDENLPKQSRQLADVLARPISVTVVKEEKGPEDRLSHLAVEVGAAEGISPGTIERADR